MQVRDEVATWDDCALTVLATVVSRPTATRAVIDAGSKSLAYDPSMATSSSATASLPAPISSSPGFQRSMA